MFWVLQTTRKILLVTELNYLSLMKQIESGFSQQTDRRAAAKTGFVSDSQTFANFEICSPKPA